MRVKLPEHLLEPIYHLCRRCKIDWFYTDYYKKKRKTINIEDATEIYFSILDLGLDMSVECHEWFSSLFVIVNFKKESK